MASRPPYQIIPQYPAHIALTKKEKDSISGLGWFGLLVWLVLAFIMQSLWVLVGMLAGLDDKAREDSFNNGYALFVIIILPIILTIAISIWLHNKRLRDLEREKNEKEIQHVEKDAESLTSRLMALLESSRKLAAQLPENISDADKWLQRAQDKFEERKFDPFWEAIEKVIHNLSAYKEATQRLSMNAREYSLSLSQREHTFPEFPIRRESLPDPERILKEFYAVLDKAQGDIHFTEVFHYRKMENLLKFGLQTVTEGVENLIATVEQSFVNLR